MHKVQNAYIRECCTRKALPEQKVQRFLCFVQTSAPSTHLVELLKQTSTVCCKNVRSDFVEWQLIPTSTFLALWTAYIIRHISFLAAIHNLQFDYSQDVLKVFVETLEKAFMKIHLYLFSVY